MLEIAPGYLVIIKIFYVLKILILKIRVIVDFIKK